MAFVGKVCWQSLRMAVQCAVEGRVVAALAVCIRMLMSPLRCRVGGRSSAPLLPAARRSQPSVRPSVRTWGRRVGTRRGGQAHCWPGYALCLHHSHGVRIRMQPPPTHRPRWTSGALSARPHWPTSPAVALHCTALHCSAAQRSPSHLIRSFDAHLCATVGHCSSPSARSASRPSAAPERRVLIHRERPVLSPLRPSARRRHG